MKPQHWQFGLEMNPQHRHFGLSGGWFGLEEAGEGSSMEVDDIGGDVNAGHPTHNKS